MEVDLLEKLNEETGQSFNDSSIKKLLLIIDELDKSGILDIIYRMAKDEEIISSVKRILSSGFLMNIIDNSDIIMNSLTTIDLSMFPHYTNAVKSIETAIKTEDVMPVGGLTGVLDKIRDEDTQKGIGIVFSLLRSLGRTCSEAEGCPFKDDNAHLK